MRKIRRLFNHPDDDIPALPGAYILVIELGAALDLTPPKGPRGRLEAGRYLYCGSARGPGGLKARIARHLRAGKKPHWHVDRLTAPALKVTAWAYVGGDECALVRALIPLPHPIPGFGSSDCRTCLSHLLAWPDGAAVDFTGLINTDGHTRMTKSGG